MDFPITTFPIGVIEHGALNILSGPIPLIGADSLQHPADIWGAWGADEWRRNRPHWRFVTVIDEPPPIAATQSIERRPEREWEVDPDAGTAKVTYLVTGKSPDDLAALLAAAKANAVTRVNAEAGVARSRFMTVTTGQEAAYAAKEREARAYAADTGPDLARYPYLAAEAAFTGVPVATVAAVVNATADACTAINAEIEGRRRGALVAIDNAGTVDAAAAVFPIAWPIATGPGGDGRTPHPERPNRRRSTGQRSGRRRPE